MNTDVHIKRKHANETWKKEKTPVFCMTASQNSGENSKLHIRYRCDLTSGMNTKFRSGKKMQLQGFLLKLNNCQIFSTASPSSIFGKSSVWYGQQCDRQLLQYVSKEEREILELALELFELTKMT